MHTLYFKAVQDMHDAENEMQEATEEFYPVALGRYRAAQQWVGALHQEIKERREKDERLDGCGD